MSYITAVGTATPKNKFDQSTLADFMANAMQLNYEEGRKLRTIFKSSGITSRHSVLEDYGKKDNFHFMLTLRILSLFHQQKKIESISRTRLST